MPEESCITTLEIHDEEQDSYIMMDVGEPVTITAKENYGRSCTFTTFLIRIETNYPTFFNKYSAVRRRYSEFCWLRNQLRILFPKESVPSLPPKKYLPFFNFNAKAIEERRAGLTLFIRRILESSILISAPQIPLFLQTDLSIAEIEGKVTKEQEISLSSLEEICVDELEVDQEESASLSVKNFSQNKNILLGSEDTFTSSGAVDVPLTRRLFNSSGDSERDTINPGSLPSSVPHSTDSGHFGGSSSAISGSNLSSLGKGTLANPKSRRGNNLKTKSRTEEMKDYPGGSRAGNYGSCTTTTTTSSSTKTNANAATAYNNKTSDYLILNPVFYLMSES